MRDADVLGASSDELVLVVERTRKPVTAPVNGIGRFPQGDQWSDQRRIGRGAVIVILSDGWDRGDPDTLATEIWSATAVADYAQAAPPALLLVAVSTPLVYFLVARRSTELGAPG